METTEKPTPTFSDVDGRTWQLRLTIGNVRRIRDAAGVDFANITDGKVFLELGADVEKFARVLWVLCEQQAEFHQLDPEKFVEAFDGATIDAAAEALIAAILNFTRASMRAPLQTVIQAALSSRQKSLTEVASLASYRVAQLADQATEKARLELAAIGEPSPSSPPSPASTSASGVIES